MDKGFMHTPDRATQLSLVLLAQLHYQKNSVIYFLDHYRFKRKADNAAEQLKQMADELKQAVSRFTL